MQTRDQKYAKDAYERVQAVFQSQHQQRAVFVASYGSMAHRLPILIHVSGLAQALTFVDARAKEESGAKRLLDDLTRTILGSEAKREKLLKLARGEKLEEQAGDAEQNTGLLSYIHLTRQVLAALLWYKRYAQSILGVEPGEDEDLIEGGDSNGGNNE